MWQKAGRFFSAVVVLCFFLPFFGISCEGVELVTISGADMVGGCKPGGAINDLAEEGKGQIQGGSIDAKIPPVDREPLAIAAMALAVIAFALAWSRARHALLGTALVAVVALGLLMTLFVRERAKMKREASTYGDAGGKNEVMGEKVEVDAGSRYGLWLTCAGLLGIAVVTGMAWREPALPDPPPPPPDWVPPPPPPA